MLARMIANTLRQFTDREPCIPEAITLFSILINITILTWTYFPMVAVLGFRNDLVKGGVSLTSYSNPHRGSKVGIGIFDEHSGIVAGSPSHGNSNRWSQFPQAKFSDTCKTDVLRRPSMVGRG
jgi:hypothetical protein